MPRWAQALWGVRYVVASVAIHGVLVLYLANLAPRDLGAVQAPIELELVEIEPPPPPEPEKPPEPEPPKPVIKPPPIKVAKAEKPPPPPKEDLPPPPNEEPPPETPPKKAPLVVGISMSSTTSSGTFSAAVGNTMYGKTADKAEDPNEVKTYSAPKYVPPHAVDSLPSVLSEPKIAYPAVAKRDGVEGQVILMLAINADGDVTDVKVVTGPGYGLNEAAVEGIKRFKFKPAIKDGRPVSTSFRYTYTFILE